MRHISLVGNKKPPINIVSALDQLAGIVLSLYTIERFGLCQQSLRNLAEEFYSAYYNLVASNGMKVPARLQTEGFSSRESNV